MRDDFSIALRRILRGWSTSLLIAGLVAVAICVNSCVFATAYGMLWKPLPYRNQDRLVELTGRSIRMGIDLGWSTPYLDRIARNNQQLADIAGYRRKDVSIADTDGRPGGTASVVLAQPHLFSILGARAERGRLFSDDDAKAGAEPVALVSEDLGQLRFGRSDSTLDRHLILDGLRYRVIGTLPHTFMFPAHSVQIWLPLSFADIETSVSNAGSFGGLRAIARIKPAATYAVVSSEMRRLVNGEPTLRRIANEIGLDLRAEPLRNLWLAGRDNSLKSMLAASCMVFAVTIANVYNFFLLRLTWRRQEFALSEATGATFQRNLRQIAIEATLLSAAATFLAIVLIPAGIALLRHYNVLPDSLPQSIGFDGATALAIAAMFLCVCFLLTTASFSLDHRNIYEVLRQSGNGQTGSPQSHRIRQALVIGQVAISIALMFGTILLVRSSYKLLGEDVGFDRSERLIGTLQSTNPNEDPSAVRQRIAGWLIQAAGIPGVQTIGLSTSAPFSPNVTLEQFQGPRSNSSSGAELPKAYVSYINSDYPRALGLRVLRGRSFTSEEASANAPVALVDTDIAERYFAGTDPQGYSIKVAIGTEERLTDVTIVGVVGRVRQRVLSARDEYPTIYLPASVPYSVPGVPLTTLDVVVRTHQPAQLAASLGHQVKKSTLDLELTNVITMERRVSETIIDLLRLNALLSILSAISIFLTTVGLYALLAHSVALRRREFGVRQALGASSHDLLLSVLMQGARMTTIASALGVPLALLVGLALRARLHDLSPADPLSLGAVCAIVFCVSMAANALPAYQASRICPMDALRSE